MMMLKRLARANFFCDRFIHLCYNMFHKKGGGCMKTISLTENQFKRLTPFRLSKDIRSTEGSFFYLDKGNWDYVREELLFKNFILIRILLWQINYLLLVCLILMMCLLVWKNLLYLNI